MAPPNAFSSAEYLANCCPILALMSGRVARIWCIRIYERRHLGFRRRVCCWKCFTYDIELPGQIRGTTILSLAGVTRVVLEKVAFVLESRSNAFGLIDISLTSVDDRDVAQSQGNDATSQNIDNVGSLVPGGSYSVSFFECK